MKSLKIFLQALEEKNGGELLYIDRWVVTPQKPMKAFKEYTVSVSVVDFNTKKILYTFTESRIGKVVTDTQDEKLREVLTKAMIISILKYYGIQ